MKRESLSSGHLHATLSGDQTSTLDEHQEGIVVVAVVAGQSAAGGPFDSRHLYEGKARVPFLCKIAGGVDLVR